MTTYSNVKVDFDAAMSVCKVGYPDLDGFWGDWMAVWLTGWVMGCWGGRKALLL